MAEITYEEVNPSPIKNTLIKKMFSDKDHIRYTITPNAGYVLHDNELDEYTEYDENGNGRGDIILGFYEGTRTLKNDYDFLKNPRKLYTITETEYKKIRQSTDLF